MKPNEENFDWQFNEVANFISEFNPLKLNHTPIYLGQYDLTFIYSTRLLRWNTK